MDRREREQILGEWGIGYESARARKERAADERDLAGSPLVGRPLPGRVRNFRIDPERYIASLGGPLPYMVRLRAIEEETLAHAEGLERAWRELAATCDGDAARFERTWRGVAAGWSFAAVNVLIERHNRYYPVEARLPMDIRTGDFALVNGESYRKRPLDTSWVLDRFPPVLSLAGG